MGEIKSPSLLELDNRIYCGKLEGLAVIRNSNGNKTNLTFYTSCIVDTKTNNVIVQYKVQAFEKDLADYAVLTTTNYQEAVAFYNELAVKLNAYRA